MFWSGFCKGAAGSWKNFSSAPYTITNSLGNWIFYTFSYSNSEKIAKTYVNGELVSTYQEFDPSVILRKSSYSMYFGRNGSSSVYYVKGKMDDLRIYNRVLSESEIQSLYHEGGWQ